MNLVKFISLSLLLSAINANAQKTYYKINGGKPVDNSIYEKTKESISKEGKLEELNLKTVTKKDSVINYVRLTTLLTTPDGFDPYAETKKFIGSKFQIENFVDENSKNFDKDYLTGKPSFINFWFTKCPPCVEEIPLLNKLKEQFGDNVNFLTISFNDKNTIDEFIKNQKFDFKHISNSKKQIDQLNISAYPTSLILDKNGIIKFVFGEVSFDIKDIELILEGLQ